MTRGRSHGMALRASLSALGAAMLLSSCALPDWEKQAAGESGAGGAAGHGGDGNGDAGSLSTATSGGAATNFAGSAGDTAPAAGGDGGSSSGGSATGGSATGGSATGGSATGGSATGGSATGGSATGGSATGGSATGGSATGGTAAAEGPCDIYAAAETPCVAAYSMVRLLSSTYVGPLYQVRRGAPSPSTGTGGQTQDIYDVEGFADAATQDAFCAGFACTVSVLYDQSGTGNDLTVATAGCIDSGTSFEDDYESDAMALPLTIAGHDVYALFTNPQEGYRNNDAVSTPEGAESQGLYMVADGTHWGTACCWDFGNVSRDNCDGVPGESAALFFGTGFWGSGDGNGPWMMADFEHGVWAGGPQDCMLDCATGNAPAANEVYNALNPSLAVQYAFGALTTEAGQYALRMGDITAGSLTTAYDGVIDVTWNLQGGIVLGVAAENSNWSYGTFYEGAVTAGRPSADTDAAVFQNVQAAGYGQ